MIRAMYRNSPVLVLASSLGLLGLGCHANAASDNNPGWLSSLIEAAKGEGEVLFYSSQSPETNRRLADSFAAKFGVKASFLRMSSATLLQRYSGEAEAN